MSPELDSIAFSKRSEEPHVLIPRTSTWYFLRQSFCRAQGAILLLELIGAPLLALLRVVPFNLLPFFFHYRIHFCMLGSDERPQ